MYMVILNKNIFFTEIKNLIDYPSISSNNKYINNDIYFTYIDFNNGLGTNTIYVHIKTLFESLLKYNDNCGTHLSFHELKQIFPNKDDLILKKIFFAFNNDLSKNISLNEFLDFFIYYVKKNKYKNIMRSIFINKIDNTTINVIKTITNSNDTKNIANCNTKNIISKNNTKNIISKNNTKNIIIKNNTKNIISKNNTKNINANYNENNTKDNKSIKFYIINFFRNIYKNVKNCFA